MESERLLKREQSSESASLYFPSSQGSSRALSSSYSNIGTTFPYRGGGGGSSGGGSHGSQLGASSNSNDFIVPRDADAKRIYQAAAAAGEHAFGVVMVDVWLLHEGQFFVHVPGSTWISPAFRAQASSTKRIAMDRILDPHHPRYCPPRPQVMGAGLAGYFWSTMDMTPSPTVDHSHSVSRNTAIDHSSSYYCNNRGEKKKTKIEEEPSLLWRELRAITSDPLQPPYPRLRLLQEAGLGKATGIPFEANAGGATKGVVLYLTRPEADEIMLSESSNVQYLHASAQYIASACSLTLPRQAAAKVRDSRLSTTWRRMSSRIKVSLSSPSLRKQQTTTSTGQSRSSHLIADGSGPLLLEWGRLTLERLINLVKAIQTCIRKRLVFVTQKSRGSDSIKPPAPAPIRTCLWTALGVGITFSILEKVSLIATTTTHQSLVLAPFGAFLTLQYSLTAAPASQPRNAIYGQSTCMLTAGIWSYAFESFAIPKSSLLIPVAAACGISLMQRLGVTHPPAGATMVALLTIGFTWTAAFWVLVGNAVAISTAVLINNLSEHRQYPVYWHWGAEMEHFLPWKQNHEKSTVGKVLRDSSRTTFRSSISMGSLDCVHAFEAEDPRLNEDQPLQF